MRSTNTAEYLILIAVVALVGIVGYAALREHVGEPRSDVAAAPDL